MATRSAIIPLVAILVVFAQAIFLASASAQIQFTTVDTVATSNSLGLSAPSINDSGTVGFIDFDNGTVYTGSGGPLTTVVTSSLFFATPFPPPGAVPTPAINDSGVVTFWASVDAAHDTGILAATPQGVTTIASLVSPVGPGIAAASYFGQSPQISNDGNVVFSTGFGSGAPGVGVFTGTGGPLTPVISTATDVKGSLDPAISHGGTIAYEWVTLQGHQAIDDLIYTVRNGVTTPIMHTGFDVGYIAVNDSGVVAAAQSHDVLIGDGTSLNTITAPSPYASGAYTSVSINNHNAVAFEATLGHFQSAIYTDISGTVAPIIESGDSLLGSTVTAIAMSREAINDRGQVTFWAELANGQQGIFVASAVPEPRSIILLILGGGLLATLRLVRASIARTGRR